MSGITLESLGIGKDEIIERVVEKIASDVMTGTTYDEDGDPVVVKSSFGHELQKEVLRRVSDAVAELAEQHIHPNIRGYIEQIVIKKTNRYGEEIGARTTFIEYLVNHAENYLTEKVNSSGKSQSEDRGGFFHPTTTRLSYMLDKHLDTWISRAMAEAVANANTVIVGGLAETVKTKLAEISTSLKVSTETRAK